VVAPPAACSPAVAAPAAMQAIGDLQQAVQPPAAVLKAALALQVTPAAAAPGHGHGRHAVAAAAAAAVPGPGHIQHAAVAEGCVPAPVTPVSAAAGSEQPQPGVYWH
jgi:hypothetical protein